MYLGCLALAVVKLLFSAELVIVFCNRGLCCFWFVICLVKTKIILCHRGVLADAVCI